MTASRDPDRSRPKLHVAIHPLVVRLTHWLNAAAIILMILSGWRIYDASPLFSFTFPRQLTLGGWLAGALQWHFAAMWLLAGSALVYVLFGIFSGHFKHSFLPVTPATVWRDLMHALRGRLGHELGVYNAVQRLAYVGVIIVILLTISSGLAIWKPVQFQELGALMGGYEGARLVHFFGMCALVLFIVIHLVMVALVPRTFIPMLTGRVRLTQRARSFGSRSQR